MTNSETTFASIKNIMGFEPVYMWRGYETPMGGCASPQSRVWPDIKFEERCDKSIPRPLAKPDPEFVKTFNQLSAPTFNQMWPQRFPAESWDRVISGAEGPPQFVTSDQCMGCHQASQHNNGQPWNMILVPEPDNIDSTQFNLSPDAEWRWSPMGVGGRDPVFFAQLESELNRAEKENISELGPCMENLCFSCHGAAGQRQLAIDTDGQGPPNSLCNPILPDNLKQPDSENGPILFTRDMMKLWPGSDPNDSDHFKYGELGREGITCTICHHATDQGFGTSASYTGNLKMGPPDMIYGPFANPKAVPMQKALGMTPVEAPWIKSSELCGSCHAINLPVLNNQGEVIHFAFEQTTYFEWLNSDFARNGEGNEYGLKSCQDCHMPTTFHRDGKTTDLEFKVANIQDNTLPPVANSVPVEDITLPVRKNFSRHMLYGLNVPLNAYAQQFPLLMGVRQHDFWSPNFPVAVPLLIARDNVLDFASRETADIFIEELKRTKKGLKATVVVKNKTGHFFPSGVSFRRAWVEFRVLDENGKTLWVSGSTNSVGLILNGATGEYLPSEFLDAPKKPGGKPQFQKHRKRVKKQDQVQIYEELTKDSDGNFTTSFVHRVKTVKDNRLRAVGWSKNGPFAEETKPEGKAKRDKDYRESPNQGLDRVIYKVKLPKGEREKIHSVVVKLYYQSTPPYYLKQRFSSAQAGPRSQDTNLLYYMTSYLDTNVRDRHGNPYLKDWKLQVGSTQARQVPPSK